MSAATRTAIADAVSTIDGLTCTPYFKTTTKAGTGMVRLDRMTRDSSGFGFTCTWQVIVLLPQDLATAEKYLESKIPALAEALAEHLVITTITPQQLDLGNGTHLPCVVIEGARESD